MQRSEALIIFAPLLQENVRVDKHGVARALNELAKFLEISDSNKFKTLAYRKAARAVEGLRDPIEELVASGRIMETPGIGKGLRPVIAELVETGKSSYLEDFRRQYPPGIFQLYRVPGLGLKKIGVLYDKLGIGTLEELEAACRSGEIGKVAGFGPKTAEKILEGIEFVRSHSDQVLLPIASAASHAAIDQLREIDAVDEVVESGAVRRKLEVVDSIDIVVVTEDADGVASEIERRGLLEQAQVDESRVAGLLRGELRASIHLVSAASFGAAMVITTGPAGFVVKLKDAAKGDSVELAIDGLRIDGRKRASKTEEAVFEALGVKYVEPELRDRDDILESRKRPRLIEREDLRGAFHVHTTYSDGRNTLIEMLEAASELGLEYVGISDHSEVASYAGGLTDAKLAAQYEELVEYRKRFKELRIFRGSEVDILENGELDYGRKRLGQFEFTVASIHSRFKMDRKAMTQRMLRALTDPHVTFLGHLTGRKLLAREGYDLDFDAVYEAAAKNDVIIEINGNPNRLDIDWRRMQRAASFGCIFSIHPDAHSIDEYRHLVTGVWHARKGGIEPEQVFNTWPLEKVEKHFERRRKLREK